MTNLQRSKKKPEIFENKSASHPQSGAIGKSFRGKGKKKLFIVLFQCVMELFPKRKVWYFGGAKRDFSRKMTLIMGIYLMANLSMAREGGLFDFDHKEPPSKETWQYFFKMPDKDRDELWRSKKKAGVELEDWPWQWRLAWVRFCSGSKKEACGRILERALFDKALVVRAETARALSVRFRATKNQKALTALEKAYQNPKNSRNGRPMYVLREILRGIRDIGGEEAMVLGKRLAGGHPDTKTFWDSLTSSEAL